MTPKDVIEKMKSLLKVAMSEEPDKQSFESGKLSDGTVIQYSVLETGGDVFIVDAEGSQLLAPAGSYELEDGSVIVVSEPGKIAEIKAKEDEATEQEMNKQPAVDYSPQITALEQANAILQKRIDALEKRSGSFTELFQAINTFMEHVANEDSKEPIHKPKQTVFGEKKDSREEVRKRTATAFAAVLGKK